MDLQKEKIVLLARRLMDCFVEPADDILKGTHYLTLCEVCAGEEILNYCLFPEVPIKMGFGLSAVTVGRVLEITTANVS